MINRRHFVATAAGSALLALAPKSPAHAIEPVQRNGKPKFKFSLAAYSYRKLLQDKESGVTLSTFVQDCASFGLEGVELTSYYFPEDVADADLIALRGECFRLGLDISGTAVRNNFGILDDTKRQAEIDHVKTWIDRAAVLHAPVIRIFAGHHPKGVDETESHRRMVAGIEECCEYAGQRGIHLALENHGGPTATAEGLLSLVQDVKSPWFCVNLDTGNFHTEDIYADLAKAAPYAVNVQVKVVVSGPNTKGKQPTDFKKLAGILRKANYRGYVVLEYEEDGDVRKECARYCDLLRDAFEV